MKTGKIMAKFRIFSKDFPKGTENRGWNNYN